MDDSSSEDRKYEDSVIYIILLLGWIESRVLYLFHLSALIYYLCTFYNLHIIDYGLVLGQTKFVGLGFFGGL